MQNKNANSNFLKYVVGIESVGKGSDKIWRGRRDVNRKGVEVSAVRRAKVSGFHTISIAHAMEIVRAMGG